MSVEVELKLNFIQQTLTESKCQAPCWVLVDMESLFYIWVWVCPDPLSRTIVQSSLLGANLGSSPGSATY